MNYIRPPAKDETHLSPSEIEILERILMGGERQADLKAKDSPGDEVTGYQDILGKFDARVVG